MTQPLLDLGDVGTIFQRVGGGAGARDVRVTGDTELLCIAAHDFVDPVRSQCGCMDARDKTAAAHSSEQGAIRVTPCREVSRYSNSRR